MIKVASDSISKRVRYLSSLSLMLSSASFRSVMSTLVPTSLSARPSGSLATALPLLCIQSSCPVLENTRNSTSKESLLPLTQSSKACSTHWRSSGKIISSHVSLAIASSSGR